MGTIKIQDTGVILQDKANKGTNGRRHQLRDTSRCACRHFTTVLFHFSNRPDALGVGGSHNMSVHEIAGGKNGQPISSRVTAYKSRVG